MSSKRLERSTRDRVLAGVIGGLSDYLNIDANLLRVIAIVLFIISPILLLVLYMVAVFLIPKAGEEKPLAATFEVEKYTLLIVGLVLVIIGAALLGSITVTPVFWIFAPYGLLVALRVIIGAILFIIGIVILIPQLRSL